MYTRLDRPHMIFSLKLGIVTLASVGVQLALDYFPRLFPARCHNYLGAFPLAMIAFAYIVYQCARRPAGKEFAKAVMLAVAFLLGQPINCCRIIVKRRSLTTLPLRSLSSMCFWSWSAGQLHRLSSPLLKP
jgi:multisubunit Na+/H+ antiporter MnhG subunit